MDEQTSLKERRTKHEIYVDILNSIESEKIKGNVKLTRIQLTSKLSYDKVKKHITALESYGLVECKPVIKITEKGKGFKEISSQALTNVENIKSKYFSNTASSVNENMSVKAQANNNTKHFIHNEKEDKTIEFNCIQKIKEQKQIQNAMQAIIEEME